MVYFPWLYHGCTMVNEPWFNNSSITIVQPKYNHGSQHEHSINCCLSPDVVIICGCIEAYIKLITCSIVTLLVNLCPKFETAVKS